MLAWAGVFFQFANRADSAERDEVLAQRYWLQRLYEHPEELTRADRAQLADLAATQDAQHHSLLYREGGIGSRYSS
jgi:hypothetical protein